MPSTFSLFYTRNTLIITIQQIDAPVTPVTHVTPGLYTYGIPKNRTQTPKSKGYKL